MEEGRFIGASRWGAPFGLFAVRSPEVDSCSSEAAALTTVLQ